MNRTQRRIAIAAVLVAAASGTAIAQQRPDREIRYRQSVMNVIGRAMGPMGAMAQGKIAFNAAVAQKNSALVETLIALPWDAFAPGTDKGAPTRASDKIWKEMPKFKKSAETTQKAAAALSAAAKGGKEAEFKAAFGELGRACNACHDDYQLDELF